MLKAIFAGVGAICVLGATGAFAQDRMPAIASENFNEAQRKAADEFLAARKVPVFGPFVPSIRSPEVMTRAREMGDYLRYKSAIGTTLSELVILITSREWTQDYEWYLHQPIAEKAGIKTEIIEAIRDGRRPSGMSDDEEIIYDFSSELHKNKSVSNRTYDRALQRFGETGVIDLIALNGYYTFLAMTMNATRMAPPVDAQRLPRFPE